MTNKEIEIFYSKTQQDWRNCLKKNRVEKYAAWMVMKLDKKELEKSQH